VAEDVPDFRFLYTTLFEIGKFELIALVCEQKPPGQLEKGFVVVVERYLVQWLVLVSRPNLGGENVFGVVLHGFQNKARRQRFVFT